MCGSGQSCVDAQTAAALYKQYMMPYAGQMSLGAPAVTNGSFLLLSPAFSLRPTSPLRTATFKLSRISQRRVKKAEIANHHA